MPETFCEELGRPPKKRSPVLRIIQKLTIFWPGKARVRRWEGLKKKRSPVLRWIQKLKMFWPGKVRGLFEELGRPQKKNDPRY